MRLQSELAAIVLGFLVLGLVLVFAAVGLFARMTPAVERILLRNDATIAAAEEILVTLAAEPPPAVEDLESVRLAMALERIETNVTEPQEPAAIAELHQALGRLAAQQPGARAAVVEALTELIAINRRAMLAADLEAQRLGQAGAWAAAFVGVLQIGFALFLVRHLSNRVVRPILDLHAVAGAARSGDPFRRCPPRAAPEELRQIAEAFNALLDARPVDAPPDEGADAAGPAA